MRIEGNSSSRSSRSTRNLKMMMKTTNPTKVSLQKHKSPMEMLIIMSAKMEMKTIITMIAIKIKISIIVTTTKTLVTMSNLIKTDNFNSSINSH